MSDGDGETLLDVLLRFLRGLPRTVVRKRRPPAFLVLSFVVFKLESNAVSLTPRMSDACGEKDGNVFPIIRMRWNIFLVEH